MNNEYNVLWSQIVTLENESNLRFQNGTFDDEKNELVTNCDHQ